MAFICADQTCLLAYAAECDKRRSPGILGTVPEPNVLGTEAVDSHNCATIPGRWCGQSSCAQYTWCVYLCGFLSAVSPGQVFLCRQLKSGVALIYIRAASCKLMGRKDRIWLNFSNWKGRYVALAGCLGSLWNCLLLICLQAAKGVRMINWTKKDFYFPVSSIWLG